MYRVLAIACGAMFDGRVGARGAGIDCLQLEVEISWYFASV